MLSHGSASPINQILTSPDGKRLLVSTLDTDELWDLETSSLVASNNNLDVEHGRQWANDPNRSDRLLLVSGARIRVFAWSTFSELSTPR